MFKKNDKRQEDGNKNSFNNFHETNIIKSTDRLSTLQSENELDEIYGYNEPTEPGKYTGWLVNMHTGDSLNEDKKLVSCMDYYFLKQDGNRFKIKVPFRPYFYVQTRPGLEYEISRFVSRRFERMASMKVDIIAKEDLDLLNHLSGIKGQFIKLSFDHEDEMRSILKPIRESVNRNKKLKKQTESALVTALDCQKDEIASDLMDEIVEIREYDVPFHVRVSIDLDIFVGHWYTVKWISQHDGPVFERRKDLLNWPDPVVMAYDIETTKLPLKFPDAEIDHVMMISYMVDQQGYLIVNRSIVSEDVEDFEFTPRPEFEGPFIVFNEPDEKATLLKFFDHVKELKPHVIVTYNGDFFDWPFVDKRASKYDLDMKTEIGFSRVTQGQEDNYLSRQCLHMDAYRWVKRDSYLPVGSQGLKAAAKAKLQFDPVELDPEEMCKMASEQPQVLATYSVSDALATYYMYMKYVHPFIFALSTIIPLEPDEVLRKGSGSLCEALLMVEAYRANIIYPNKQREDNESTYRGHLLSTETYVGGRVEAIECGVFRADFPEKFRLDPEAYEALIMNVERTMTFSLEKEEGVPVDMVTNYQEVCDQIKSALEDLRDRPNRLENPLIYHLDVGAMYPNIILTNRLQPPALINEEVCASCVYNESDAPCRRAMEWMWRGDYYPANKNEVGRIRQQLETEKFMSKNEMVPFHKLMENDRSAKLKERVTEYCRRAYRKIKITKEEKRVNIICQRENSFYVDTVRAFRDRRYEFKGLLKQSKKKLEAAQKLGDPIEIKNVNGLVVLYDSLQLAHKCILNSFYGYVMRKGSRWHSMEMAGIVCYTGANIIRNAREIVERIGRPLELDTDGIWCILPGSFPENFTFKTKHEKKKSITVSYPGAILNVMVDDLFTNLQYHELDKETGEYTKRDENSIYFEVDGPYKAMILPASTEQGRKLKKRYAVFNFDGSLAELKGFELKRRGELGLVKIFQSSLFDKFLAGNTLKECYQEVARVADYWIDVLFSKAANMPNDELFDLIAENRSMSRKLEDYGQQKSTSISTAKRLAQFLGDDMVKDAGLACRFVISKYPTGAPVTERAIPLAIFQAEQSVQRHYVKKWTKESSMEDFDIRKIIDWQYYFERFAGTIQKIITIPAALQNIPNPVPRIKHPEWLHKELLQRNDPFKQGLIGDFFTKTSERITVEEYNRKQTETVPDIEEIGAEGTKRPPMPKNRKRTRQEEEDIIINQTWEEALGEMPIYGTTADERRKWFLFLKRKWAYQIKRKRIIRRVGRSVQPSSKQVTLGVMRKRTRTVFDQFWHIIQINHLGNGEYRLWAMIGDELHPMNVTVPRIFYVNRKTPKKDDVGPVWRKVHKILPRSTPAIHLYEYEIKESDFIEHILEIETELNGPEIEGVYELDVPLDFRILVNIGCLCTVSREAARRMPKTGADHFELGDLEFRNCSEEVYLNKISIRKIFLYHIHKDDKTQFFSLFANEKCYIFVLARARENLLPNVSKLWRKYIEQLMEENEDVKFLPQNVKFDEVRVETREDSVIKAIGKTIYQERRGPTMLCYQTSRDNCPIKVDDMPLVALPKLPKNELAERTTDWQKAAAELYIERLAVHLMELEKLKEKSRFYHLPVGNIPNDPVLYGGDVFFARHLTKSGHLLWCSKSRRPDLGGREKDLARLESDTDELPPVVDKKGLYTGFTIQLSISGMAEAALLQSHNLTELDGFETFQQGAVDAQLNTDGRLLTNYSESTLAMPQYRILKLMVSTWVKEIAQFNNPFADIQIQHLMRYITSTNTLLYDPAIVGLLVSSIYRLFKLLSNELSHLGCTVVHASPDKLFLCSGKDAIQNAISYADFIERTLVKKEYFQALDFKFENAWSIMLWHDINNFAGNLVSLGDKEEEEDHEAELHFKWLDYLPTEGSIRKSLETLIIGYIKAMYIQYREEDYNKQKFAEYAQGLLAGEFSDHLMEVVEKIRTRFPPGAERSKAIFPVLAGSHLKLDNPALFYAKTVMQILSAHADVEEEVRLLRRNLFRILKTSEFAASGEWIDPVSKLILRDIVCYQCGVTQDVNLGISLHPDCDCTQKDDQTNLIIVEQRLIDLVKHKIITWNIQDVVCTKCNAVRMRDISNLCECSGKFEVMEDGQQVQEFVRVVRALADFYKMDILKSMMDWIIGTQGCRKSGAIKIEKKVI